eukprot:15661268-Heterocapsa_arctica.AAC.1
MGDYEASKDHNTTNKRKEGIIFKDEIKKDPVSRASTSLDHNWMLSSWLTTVKIMLCSFKNTGD